MFVTLVWSRVIFRNGRRKFWIRILRSAKKKNDYSDYFNISFIFFECVVWLNVFFPKLFSYHFCSLTRCSIMLEKAQFITSPFSDDWEKLRSQDVLATFLIGGQHWEWIYSPGWAANPHMNGLRMLWCCISNAQVMIGLTCSCSDRVLVRCLKQSDRRFIKENDFTTVLSSPVSVSFVEYQSVLHVFLCCCSVCAHGFTHAWCLSWASLAIPRYYFLCHPEAFFTTVKPLSLKFSMIW